MRRLYASKKELFPSLQDKKGTKQKTVLLGENMSGYLKLNPESIKEKNSSYSSLTDLYHVELFTNQFKHSVEAQQIEEKKKYDEVYSNIFIKDYAYQTSKNQELAEKLFADKIENSIREDYKTIQADSTHYYGAAGLFIFLLFAALFAKYYFKKKKEKKNYAADSNRIPT